MPQDKITTDRQVVIAKVYLLHLTPGRPYFFRPERLTEKIQGLLIGRFQPHIDDGMIRQTTQSVKQKIFRLEKRVDTAEKEEIGPPPMVGGGKVQDIVGQLGGSRQDLFTRRQGIVLAQRQGILINEIRPIELF